MALNFFWALMRDYLMSEYRHARKHTQCRHEIPPAEYSIALILTHGENDDGGSISDFRRKVAAISHCILDAGPC